MIYSDAFGNSLAVTIIRSECNGSTGPSEMIHIKQKCYKKDQSSTFL